MEAISPEQRLKHFQLALSMVGISANLMTCELIASLANVVNEKGPAFNLGDAERIAQAVQRKYQMQQQPPVQTAPPVPEPKEVIMNIKEENSSQLKNES